MVVAERTLHRYIDAKFPKSDQSTVRVADGEPGSELQVDFGELGLMFDDESGRRRKVWAFFGAVFKVVIPGNNGHDRDHGGRDGPGGPDVEPGVHRLRAGPRTRRSPSSSSANSAGTRPPQRDMARRLAEGKSRKEIIRCLMRYIARKIHHAITADTTGPDQHRTPQPTAA